MHICEVEKSPFTRWIDILLQELFSLDIYLRLVCSESILNTPFYCLPSMGTSYLLQREMGYMYEMLPWVGGVVYLATA